MPEIARFNGGLGIAAERADFGVRPENFSGGGGGSVPAAAVEDKDGNGNGECGSDDSGDGHREEFAV